jgi:subtilisin-like proprotein convertase family protein
MRVSILAVALTCTLSAHAAQVRRTWIDSAGSVTSVEAIEAGADPWKSVAAAKPELALHDGVIVHEATQASLAATHHRYRQKIDGLPVLNGEVVISVAGNGLVRSVYRSLAESRRDTVRIAATGAGAGARAHEGWWMVDGSARPVRVDVAGAFPRQTRIVIDLATGEELDRRDLFYEKRARYFPVNPVVRSNDASLQDRNDTASAIPPSSYETVELAGLDPGAARLAGPYVRIVDNDAPSTPADPPSGATLFDRSQPEFEEANVYVHIDSAQRYMQSLGFNGSRSIAAFPIPVDVHALEGVDNSLYSSSGGGSLFFGDGGVDDAEDPEIVMHEYGHAIQDSIAPFLFSGSFATEARAAGEGFGDYWAFSTSYDASVASGRDPLCIGDWDARCGNAPSTQCSYPAGADCLRRVDSQKTMADYVSSNQRGVEHRNGAIWSSLLREIFLSYRAKFGALEGRRRADTIVLESHFGLPSSPSFAMLARNMIAADRALHAGSNVASICGALTLRRIVVSGECASIPRGETTIFSAVDVGVTIPENTPVAFRRSIADARRIVRAAVHVSIRHPRGSDLTVELVTPWGEEITLRRASTGADIRGTFGVDLIPDESLASLDGRAANGEWTLRVSDSVSGETGVLEQWSLQLQLEGNEVISIRPVDRQSLVIPAVADGAGANGTRFVSDVRIFNDSSQRANVVLLFTPSGRDGRSEFLAQRLQIGAGEIALLDRLVSSVFATSGLGSVEIRGDVANLVVTSRTYNETATGTFGQFIPVEPSASREAAGTGSIVVAPLRDDASFRSNFGLVETRGVGGSVELITRNASGSEIERRSLPIAPFSHLQLPFASAATAGCVACRIEVRADGGGVKAYGSIVDNRSGDAIFIPARAASTGAVNVVIPAAIKGAGANGTNWRSDLYLENLSSSGNRVVLRLNLASGESVSTAVNLAPNESRLTSDFVSALFGREGTATLSISSDSSIAASSRIWNDAAAGTFGQYVPGYDARELLSAGQRGTLLQIAQTPAYRTNLGLMQSGGGSATVRISVFDASGTRIAMSDQLLSGETLVPIPLARQIGTELRAGRIEIEVVSGSGVAAYASVVDNRTGDPVFIRPERRQLSF